MLWANLYEDGILVIGDTRYDQGGRRLTATECPTIGPWFWEFIMGSKFIMGLTLKKILRSDIQGGPGNYGGVGEKVGSRVGK